MDNFEANAGIKRLATPVSLYSVLATGEEVAINALNTFKIEVAVTGVVLFDLGGRKVSKEKFTAQRNYQVDLNTLDSAMYFVEITTKTVR